MLRILLFCTLFATPILAQARLVAGSPQSITEQDALLYKWALESTHDSLYVEQYANRYDYAAYARAINNEFERRAYRARTAKLIEERIRTVDFNRRFVIVVPGQFSEYSFARNVFVLGTNFGSENFDFSMTEQQKIERRATPPIKDLPDIRIERVSNGAQFNFMLPMREDSAQVLVDRRQDKKRDFVNRTLRYRITYSIDSIPGAKALSRHVYSVEVVDGGADPAHSNDRLGYVLPVAVVASEVPDGVNVVVNSGTKGGSNNTPAIRLAEHLNEARRQLSAGNSSAAAEAARSALVLEPQNSGANIVLGQALMISHEYNDAIVALASGLSAGEVVGFSLFSDGASFPYHYLHSSRLTFSRDSLSLTSEPGGGSFSVSLTSVVAEMERSLRSPPYLRLVVTTINPKNGKPKKDRYSMFPLSASLLGVTQGSVGTAVRCDDCKSMTEFYMKLFAQLQQK